MTRQMEAVEPHMCAQGMQATRRGAVRTLWGAGIVCAAFVAPRSFAQTALRLPQGPQILTRQLTRSLSDGNQIKVTRSWQVQFARANQNMSGQIAITGVQISSEVEAPPSLNPLAAIERQRPTDGMWPIMLTPSGLILAAGRPMRQQDIEDALDTGQKMMAARMGQQNAANMVGTFAAQLQRTGTSLLDRLPDDLFFPTIGPIRSARKIDLPGGEAGEFEVAYEAVAVAGKGWLDRAERRITTRLAGTEQCAKEHWSLRPL